MGRPGPERKETVFAANLERLREERGLSKTHLADLAGIGRATYFRVLSGEDPSAKTVSRLASALEVHESDLWAQATMSVPMIEPAIQSFIKSPWASVIEPALSDVDVQRLRKLPGTLWLNVRPSDKVLYHLVLAQRASSNQQ